MWCEKTISIKINQLHFIQDIIRDLANKSFVLKVLSVTLVSGLVAAARDKAAIIGFAMIPIIVFWILDGYFLWQERLFRKVYDEVRQKEEADIDFAMNPQRFINEKTTWVRTVFSKTIVVFYGSLLSVMIAVVIFLLK
jgi:hypothetical protein